MSGATAERVSDQDIERARAADLFALAERYTQLKKNAHHDWAGACPKCAGTDRFHVFQKGGEWRWRCYQCSDKPADVIAFVQWVRPGVGFTEAVLELIGGLPSSPPAARRSPAPVQRQQPAQPATWQQKAERIVAEAQALLWSTEGKPGQAYLESRALESHTWLTYGLGYRPDAAVPGTDGSQRAPAIVLPWKAGGKLVAVRYRFLEAQGGHRLTAEGGSQFADRLFGGQALPQYGPAPEGHRPIEALRTLVIVEGEINGMSCWQAAGECLLDVLSMGSESAHLSPAAVQFAQRYGTVIAWADKEKIAQGLLSVLPGAHGVRSPGGKDANDLLRAGLLGGFLATVRADAAKSMGALEALLWALWDSANTMRGIDTGSAQVAMSLAAKLGKQVRLVQAEPDRWITAESLGHA